jgi:hypothetical protein
VSAGKATGGRWWAGDLNKKGWLIGEKRGLLRKLAGKTQGPMGEAAKRILLGAPKKKKI